MFSWSKTVKVTWFETCKQPHGDKLLLRITFTLCSVLFCSVLRLELSLGIMPGLVAELLATLGAKGGGKLGRLAMR